MMLHAHKPKKQAWIETEGIELSTLALIVGGTVALIAAAGHLSQYLCSRRAARRELKKQLTPLQDQLCELRAENVQLRTEVAELKAKAAE